MKHLDLGCGSRPHNPYFADELYGVDIAQIAPQPGVVFKQADISKSAIPFGDSFFDSISAFDVLEHIPRVIQYPTVHDTRFAFVELMNEIWRVLKDGGLFYGVTPAYPHPQAFQDPTHVNIITDQTHEYFCGERLASIYGFHGNFVAQRVRWDHPKNLQDAEDNMRKSLRRLNRALKLKRCSHLLWEFRAVK